MSTAPPPALAAADELGARLGATRTEPAANHQLEALALAVTANQPVLLWGEPGIGKSAGMERLAGSLGVALETVVASVHEPSDFAGLPIVGDDPATTGVPMAPPDWAVRLARTGHGLLFFDELSSAPPAVQAALLRVVLERRVGSLELPASVRIVAAANPPASAADGWHLSAPLANRFVHLDWTHDPRTVARGMAGTWPETALPAVDPARSAGAVARARGAVSGFLTARPGLVHHMPDDAEARGRAWPSPRTWEMALRLLATRLRGRRGPRGAVRRPHRGRRRRSRPGSADLPGAPGPARPGTRAGRPRRLRAARARGPAAGLPHRGRRRRPGGTHPLFSGRLAGRSSPRPSTRACPTWQRGFFADFAAMRDLFLSLSPRASTPSWNCSSWPGPCPAPA
ncbi:LOW QUALITY PROTEIN: ATPase, partial [Streptomyces sp. C]